MGIEKHGEYLQGYKIIIVGNCQLGSYSNWSRVKLKIDFFYFWLYETHLAAVSSLSISSSSFRVAMVGGGSSLL